MQSGHLLYTKIGEIYYTFRLDGTAQALPALVDCVRTYANSKVAVAPANPPTPAPTTPAVVQPKDKPNRGAISTGSGFFVGGAGMGLTNAHVVEGCASATLLGYGPARIVARDSLNDMALVELSGKTSTPAARFRSEPLQLGETVYALGFPLAGQLDNGLNFTSGLVSSLAGMGNDTRSLQFTAPIQPGNSGGPIVDGRGLIVGVVQSKLSEMAALTQSGSLPQNINFGIKADLAANFLRANGVDPKIEAGAPLQEATAIARDGRNYTFQISCKIQ